MLDLDLILKNNELCLVGEPRGRVSRAESGLYLRDTRFLDRLEFSFRDEPLQTLEVQTPAPDHVVVTATNPEYFIGERLVEGHSVLFRIDMQLTTTLMCHVTVENFGREAVSGEVDIVVSADFHDMFDVRGNKPRHPVTPRPPEIHGTTATLSAEGSDGVIVSTIVTGPDTARIRELDDASDTSGVTMHVPLELEPRGTSNGITLEIAPQPFGPPLHDAASQESGPGFEPALTLHTPSTHFDEFIAQCDADLALLQTSFPDGNIPAAGIPWFIAPFGRDSLIVALQTMQIYPVRSEHTLRLLARLQGKKHDPFREEQPGKILHEMRYGDMARTGQIPHTPYYGSIDSTPLFVMTFARHYRSHRDEALYDDLIDNVRRALTWMETDGDMDGDGFLEFPGEQLDYTHISQQGWKDSGDSLNFADGRPVRGPIALVEVQGYAYAAYAWLAEAVRLRGDNAWADELDAKADAIRQKVEEMFWMEDEGFYAQALDGEKRQVDAISSNPGHLLYCGLPSKERAARVAERFARPDMNSGWGIRTLSSEMATYNPMSYHNGSVWPHDVSLAMAGLAKYGHVDLARELAEAITTLALNDPELRIAELYCGFGKDETKTGPVNYPSSCLPQAWAAGAGILAATALLGVDVDDRGQLTASPHLPDDWDAVDAHGFRVGDRTYGISARRTANGWAVSIAES